jgi:hypothetical protein
VIAAFAKKLATVSFEMPDEIPALHVVGINGSRITSCPRNSSSAN